jgi:hypothetical protein
MFGINEIWLLLGIPLMVTIWLMILYRRATKVWELLLIWAVAIVAIFVSQVIVEKVSVSDWEVWGYNSVQATFNEPFQYWDTCSETYACGQSCTGSGSSRSCSTTYYTRYYPCKQWGGNDAWLLDDAGGKRYISPARFKKLENEKWKNSKTIELHREKTYKIIVDGDRRVTKWPGTWQTAEPIAEEHTYENRTQCSSTIRFLDVSKEEASRIGLFNYPTFYGGYEVQTVMDQNGKYWREADQRWRYMNGVLGNKRRLRLWVFIYRDFDRDIIHKQAGWLKNGNKNEFIICIGADKVGNVKWADVISWTEVEELKIEFRDEIPNVIDKVDSDSLIKLADWAEPKLQRYIKPEFTKKFEHLSVQPSLLSMIITAIVILLINVGTAIWVVKNDFYEIDPDTFPRRPKRDEPGRSRQTDYPHKPSHMKYRGKRGTR